jgi:hypothetical protein
MIVTTLHRSSLGAAFFALLAVSADTQAAPPAACDKIAQDVRESVEKDPTKVLMYVEDALVINETCACEIVRAAITAAKADANLIKQIVQTSVAVAPRMTAVIEDCASAGSSGAPVASKEDSSKSGKDVVDVTSGKSGGKDGMDVLPPKDGGETKSSFSRGGADIRGLYLIQPATGVFGGGTPTPETPKAKKEDKEKERIRTRIVYVHPTSPTVSKPKDDEPKVD